MHIRVHVGEVEDGSRVLVDVRCKFPRAAIFASRIKQQHRFKSGVAPHGHFAWLACDCFKLSNCAFAVIFRAHAGRHDPAAHVSEPHATLLNQGLHFRALSGAVQDVSEEDRCIKRVRRLARNQDAQAIDGLIAASEVVINDRPRHANAVVARDEALRAFERFFCNSQAVHTDRAACNAKPGLAVARVAAQHVARKMLGIQKIAALQQALKFCPLIDRRWHGVRMLLVTAVRPLREMLDQSHSLPNAHS